MCDYCERDKYLNSLLKEKGEAQKIIKRLYEKLGTNANLDHELWKETEVYCKEHKLI